jgi:isoleucyl-tRNA synthetase
MQTTERVRKCFARHESYITGEVLAREVLFGPCEGTPWDLNGEATFISIQKCKG